MNEIFTKAVTEFEAHNYSEAYKLFEDVCEYNSDAMVNLAIMHMQGRGCTQSYELASVWFERAAKKGNIKAQRSLGIIYEKGMIGESDEQKAFEYYKLAADQGEVDAQLKVGMFYKQQGNNLEAMRYLITAAHNNNAQAQTLITYVSNKEVSQERNEPFYELSPLQQRALIENLLETKIRPSLAIDGGGIELINFITGENPQIWLSYLGTCSGCHLGSTSTADMLLNHFETMIDKNVILYLM